jgi:hypothetical protein
MSDAYCDECAGKYEDTFWPKRISLKHAKCPVCGGKDFSFDAQDIKSPIVCKTCNAVISGYTAFRRIETAIDFVERKDEPNLPTEEGRKRYEPDGYYEGIACICDKQCPVDCKGECGCEACQNAYSDFLSCELD